MSALPSTADRVAAMPRRHISRSVSFSLLAAAIGLAACDDNAAQQGGAPPPPPVSVAKPVVKNIVEIDEFTGRFEAVGSVDIRARVGGYLESVNFTDGALVKKGDLLFVIDKRPFEAALNEAEATLASAKAQLEYTRRELARVQPLARQGYSAQSSLDDRRNQFQAAQASLAGAEAAVVQARLNLEFTEVRAPISGRISRKLVTEGNLVNANETLLTTIVSLDPIYFYFDIDERSFLAYSRQAQKERPDTGMRGLDVSVALADEKTFQHKGRLDFQDNRVDSESGTMRLRAVIDNPNLFLAPGLFGRVAMPGSPSYRAVLLPDEAIVSDLSRRLVYAVGEEGQVKQVEVRVGPRQDGYRVIREGLTGDETIVVNGLQRVRLGGGRVTPQMTELPPSR